VFHNFVKLVAIKALGLSLLLIGIWIGLIAFFGDEPWNRHVFVQYGGAIVAWFFGALGVGLMTKTFPRVTPESDTDDSRDA
jgi:hypothetical protein